MGKRTSQAHRQKWRTAFETVMLNHNDFNSFISFNQIYNEYHDEMRLMGIKAYIATRTELVYFITTNYPLMEKERMIINGRRAIHYKMVK